MRVNGVANVQSTARKERLESSMELFQGELCETVKSLSAYALVEDRPWISD